MHKTILAILLGASAAAGQAATTINFNTPGNTNPGPTASFGSPAVIATGYMCGASCVTTDLYIKNLGGSEQGLGLNNDPSGEHELWYGGQDVIPAIQLNVSALLGLTSGASFTMNSTSDGEWWAVYGATGAAGAGAVLLGTGNDQLSHAFASWGTYSFYDFISLGTFTGGTPGNCGQGCTHTGGNVLISSLSYTPGVPEPSTWALMLLGFGGIGMSLRGRRKVGLAQIA